MVFEKGHPKSFFFLQVLFRGDMVVMILGSIAMLG